MSDIKNSLSLSENKNKTNNYVIPNYYIGKVVSIDDPNKANRIKVYISNVDYDKLVNGKVDIDKLVYCEPNIPPHFFILPKVGEYVRIHIGNDKDNSRSDRYWTGPIITQLTKLEYDSIPFRKSNLGLNNDIRAYQPNPDTIPESKGLFPENDDIALLGRTNSDLILKTNQVLLRTNKYSELDKLKINNVNPSYIQLLVSDKKTYTNVVSEKINLISGDLSNGIEKLISEGNINDIMSKLHPSVYGDVLQIFIKYMIDFVKNHVHPYHGMPPDKQVGSYKELVNFDLNSIISDNIKIN
jgi:hypothetical protein